MCIQCVSMCGVFSSSQECLAWFQSCFCGSSLVESSDKAAEMLMILMREEAPGSKPRKIIVFVILMMDAVAVIILEKFLISQVLYPPIGKFPCLCLCSSFFSFTGWPNQRTNSVPYDRGLVVQPLGSPTNCTYTDAAKGLDTTRDKPWGCLKEG
ncbi:hypothetical protein Acr_16g0000680 [Actinidia rufa]|uniref:Uncharacterized protein n=1 Tax=Actinidia rufa TaxID=165716 RepID=A0A7J0FXY8_9ERIC|nr:hypothetical protein Acr_16g0000680 [Actinidia rufa]